MKLKDYFNKDYAIFLVKKVTEVYPMFDSITFLKQVENKIQD